MALLDFFKKKKKPLASAKATAGEKKKKSEKKIEEIKKPASAKASAGKEEIIKPPTFGEKAGGKPEIKRAKKKISEIAYRVLYSPHITEKATALTEENKYVFKVSEKSNKIEIKKAIEDLYGIDVIGVNIINIPRRQRRLGKQTGWRKGYKKAIVKIKGGQKIEILSR